MEECPVCLIPLSGSVTTVACCKKQFHTECIMKCTERKNECPMCRSQQVIQEVFVPVLYHNEEEQQLTRQKVIAASCMCGIMLVASYVLIKIW
jgi:hypothetical protein